MVSKTPSNKREVVEYANCVASGFELSDDVYIMDVAQLANDAFKVIELNALSTSGFYNLSADLWLPHAQQALLKVVESWNP